MLKKLCFLLLGAFSLSINTDGFPFVDHVKFVDPTVQDLDFYKTYPHFDLSLKRYGQSNRIYKRSLSEKNAINSQEYKQRHKAKKLYDLRKKEADELAPEEQIPRIVHQIWIGSPVPEKYKVLMKTWQNWEGWTYMLWTDEEVKNLTLQNAELFENAHNYGERADIIRYELLNQIGGLYVDVDFECINPNFFDFAHEHYQFYVGIEPLEHTPMSCCNALMASIPGHPAIVEIVQGLEANVLEHEDNKTFERTGPRYISRSIYNNFTQLVNGNGILFPPTFFYPFAQGENKAFLQNDNLFIHPETAAVHYWEGSWQKDEAQIHHDKRK